MAEHVQHSGQLTRMRRHQNALGANRSRTSGTPPDALLERPRVDNARQSGVKRQPHGMILILVGLDAGPEQPRLNPALPRNSFWDSRQDVIRHLRRSDVPDDTHAGSYRAQSSEHRRPRVGVRTSDYPQDSPGVLVIRPRRHGPPRPDATRRQPPHQRLWGQLAGQPDINENQTTGRMGRRRQQKAWLEGTEGDRHVCVNMRAGYLAGIWINPARQVNCYDGDPIRNRGDQLVRGVAQPSRASVTHNTIDNQVCDSQSRPTRRPARLRASVNYGAVASAERGKTRPIRLSTYQQGVDLCPTRTQVHPGQQRVRAILAGPDQEHDAATVHAATALPQHLGARDRKSGRCPTYQHIVRPGV
jgi:hypothetical protein